MAWLSQKGVEFEDRDIRANPDFVQELVALRSQGTPTTVIRNEDEEGDPVVIIGFRQKELTEALGLSAG